MSDELEVRLGFRVVISTHTEDAREKLHPALVREVLGRLLDGRGLQEEVDYTLEVERIYGQVDQPISGPVLGTCCLRKHLMLGEHERHFKCLHWRPLAGTEER